MMRILAIASMLCAATAFAQAPSDPLEEQALSQGRAQDPVAVQVGAFLKGAGKKTDFQVTLDANKCYWFSAASEGADKLAMFLWAPGSNMFTPRLTDSKSSGRGTLAHCTKVTGVYRFQVKTDGGRYAVALFAKDAPGVVAPPAPVLDVAALCDKAGTSSGAKRVGEFFEGHSDKNDFVVQMDQGKCYSLVACGDPAQVKSIYLYLWDPASKRIPESKTDSSTPMIGHCAKETGMFKVQAKVNSGKGDTKVGVYSK